MSGGHAHGLFLHTGSPVHSLAPECKVAAWIVFVLSVAVTPREAFWAFGVYALLLSVALWASKIGWRRVVRRFAIEIPFVLFALALPFFGGGDTVEILGFSLHSDGLWAAWNVLAKATLGFGATIALAGSTETADVIRGLERLGAPRVVTAIAGSMIRYIDIVTGEVRRMAIARTARGYDPRWFWQARALASTAGTLFIRSYERGERVHTAMLSRAFPGSFVRTDTRSAPAGDWLSALLPALLAAFVALIAWIVR